MMFYVDLYSLCIYCLIEMRFKTRRYVYYSPIFKNIPDIFSSLINFFDRCGRCGRHLEHCSHNQKKKPNIVVDLQTHLPHLLSLLIKQSLFYFLNNHEDN